MSTLFGRFWWMFLVRGILAVVLGLFAFFMPEATFAGLVIFLGGYMFVEGVFSLIAAFTEKKTVKTWWPMLLTGLFGILVGIITFINPFATGAALVYFIAFWALVIGIAEIALAIRLRKLIKGEGWYMLAGALTILFSILVFMNPVAGALTLTVLFGAYALVMGVMMILLGLRLRHKNNPSYHSQHLAV